MDTHLKTMTRESLLSRLINTVCLCMKVNKAIRSHVSFLIRSSRVEQCYKNKSDTFLRFQLQACAVKYLFIVETSSMKTTILSLSNLQEPEESVRPKNSCTGALFYILNTTFCNHHVTISMHMTTDLNYLRCIIEH